MDKILVRQAAFAESKKMVDPIVEQHGLTPIRRSAPVFTQADTTSAAEQHIDLIIQVADWMMQDG